MEEKTFTYTARSLEDPKRVATFTLQNGNVNIELGNAMMEQFNQAIDSIEDENSKAAEWLKPLATGALNRTLQPFPVEDFDARLEEDRLRLTAWLRAGGLRLAPISFDWNQVDNPQGARAFVAELMERRQEHDTGKMPQLFDYWLTWAVVVGVWVLLPIGYLLRRRSQE